MKIENINQFLDEIRSAISCCVNPPFYRGHSNEEKFKLVPFIYRDKRFIENEDKIYRETIAKVPYDFNGKNTIESLVLMQHYGVPTRILDLTTNPLVALYFACDDDKNKDADGEVIVFDIPEESTCYFDSDRVAILANIAKCNNIFYTNRNLEKYEQYKRKLSILKKKNDSIDYNYLNRLLKNENLSYINIDSQINDFVDQITKENTLSSETDNKIECFIKEAQNSIKITPFFSYKNKEIDSFRVSLPSKSKDKILSALNEAYAVKRIEKIKTILFSIKSLSFITKLEDKILSFINEEISWINMCYFEKLLNFIKEDKPYFISVIDPRDINKVFAIKPKLDNPRIVRQQGAFLIFGIEEQETPHSDKPPKKMSKVPSEWVIRGKVEIEKNEFDELIDTSSESGKQREVKKRFIIKSSHKKDIIDELNRLGINKSTLFPEIDKVADYIKEKYTTKN